MNKNTVSEDNQSLMLLLLAHWKTMLVISFLGAVLAYGISWIVPKKYESSATIYVREEPMGTMAMAASMMGMSLSNRNTSGYMVSVMEGRPMKRLVARSLAKADVKKLRLDIHPLPITVKEDERKGSLVLVCRTHNPILSAKIVNEVLDNLSRLMTSSSSRKAQYLSKRLDETQTELDAAGDALRRFEEKHSISLLPEDAKAMIERLKYVEAEQMKLRVSLQTIESELTNAADPEVLVNLKVRREAEQSALGYIEKEAAELRRQFSTLPSVAQQYANLQRRIAVLDKTYAILSEQYQTATLVQVGEDGDYEIIERGEPERRPVSPRKFWAAMMGACLAFLVTWSALYVKSGASYRSPK